MNRTRRPGALAGVVLTFLAASTAVGVGAPSSIAAGHRVARPARALPLHAPARRTAGSIPAWTYMVFMNADNNIEQDEIQHLDEMTKARYGGNVKVVVLVDRAIGGYDGTAAGLPNTDGGQLLEVQAGRAKLLSNLGQIDMGSGDTLAWFIQEAASRYPARHYALSISDHGGGWLGASQDSGPNASGSRATMISTDAIAAALARGEQAAGLGKLDLLIYDACLMSEYEVAKAMAPYALLMVADEEEELGTGFIDEEQINLMDGGAAPLVIAKSFVDSYATAIKQASQANQDAVAFSVTDLGAIDRFHRAMGSLEQALVANMPAVAAQLSRARNQVLTYGSLDPGSNAFQTVDLGDLLNHLDPAALPPDVAGARDAVLTAIGTVRLYQQVGAANRQALGLSIYFPPDQATAGSLLARYKQINGSDDWAPVLDAFYAAAAKTGDGQPPTLASGPTFDRLDASGVSLSGTVGDATEARLAGARGQWGFVAADGTPNVLVTGPATVDAGTRGTIQAPWAFEYLRLTDGKHAMAGTVFLQQQSGTIRGSMPLIYRTAGGQEASAELSMTLDANLNVAYGKVYELDQSGAVAQLSPEPGSVLIPEVQLSSSGKTVLAREAGPGISADSLSLETVRLPPRTTFFGALRLTTIDGSTYASGLKGTVP